MNRNRLHPECLPLEMRRHAAWVKVTSGPNGVDSGAVSYTVDPSSSKATRTGTVTIGGQTFTVTQQGVKLAAANNPVMNPEG